MASFKYHLPNYFFSLNFICFHVLHNVWRKKSEIFMMAKTFSCNDLFSRLWWSIRARLFSKSSLAWLQEFWNSSICLYDIKKKNMSKTTCPTGSFTCPGPSGSGKRQALSIYWWVMWFRCGFEYVAKNHHSVYIYIYTYRDSDWNLCWQSGNFFMPTPWQPCSVLLPRSLGHMYMM